MMLDDPEMREMAQEELREAKEKRTTGANITGTAAAEKIRTMNETRS